MTQREEIDARFKALYGRRFRPVLAYFLRVGFPHDDALELTQETFLRVYPHMKNFRGKTEAEEAAYVHKAAITVRANTLRGKDTQKRKGKEESLDGSPQGEVGQDQKIPDRSPTPEEELSHKQERTFQRKRLYRAICKLPSDTRCCLLLQLAGLKLREITAAMGISLDAVKGRLQDAKKRLKESLGEEIDWSLRSEESDD